MLASQIEVGKTYIIRHHDGHFCTVRVEWIEGPQPNSMFHKRTHYRCTKLSTGNIIEVKSAAKFRKEVV